MDEFDQILADADLEEEAEVSTPQGEGELEEFDQILASEGEDPNPEPVDGDYQDLALLDIPLEAVKNVGKGIGGAALNAAAHPIQTGGAVLEGAGNLIGGIPEAYAGAEEYVRQNPTAPADAVGGMAMTMAGAGAGASVGAALGTPVPIIGNVVGGVVGGAVGAGLGYLGWGSVVDSIKGTITPESFKQDLGEAVEITTGDLIATPLSRVAGRMKGGRTGIQQKTADALAKSKNSRSAPKQVQMMLGKSGSRHVSIDDLNKAGKIGGEELVTTMTAGKVPITEDNVLKVMRDSIGKRNDGGLLDKYGAQVGAYLRKANKSYTLDDAKHLFKDAADDSLLKTNRFDVETVNKIKGKVRGAITTRYAEAAGFSSKQVDDHVRTLSRLRKAERELLQASKSGKATAQLDDLVTSLTEEVNNFNSILKDAKLDTEDFWELTNEAIRTNKLNFNDVDLTPHNNLLLKYREVVQNDIKKSLGADLASGYQVANDKYSAFRNVFDWADDGIVALQNKQGLSKTLAGNLYRDIRGGFQRTKEELPRIVEHFRAADEAIFMNHKGSPTRFRALADLLVNTVPKTIGGSVEEIFSLETFGALQAARLITEEFLKTNPPTEEEMRRGGNAPERMLETLTASANMIQEGMNKSPEEQLGMVSQATKDPVLSPAINLASGGGLMEGVKVLGGKPVDGASLEKYFRNLNNDTTLNSFEKADRRRHFNEKGTFMKEPEGEEKSEEIDKAEVQKQIQMNKAREDVSRFKSSKDVVKFSRMSSQVGEQKKNRNLSLVSFNDSYSDDFDTAFDVVLGNEGGFVDRADDPGGRTNYGVTQKTFNSYLRSVGRRQKDVSEISQDEVKEVYKTFWEDSGASQLPSPLSTIVFDAAINSGPSKAKKQLQAVLGVKRDGRIGPETLEALEGQNIGRIARDFLDVREEFYEGLGKPQFIRGWKNRVKKMRRLVGSDNITRLA